MPITVSPNMTWSTIDALCKERIEIVLAQILRITESDIDFADIIDNIKSDYSKLKKFLILCKRLYSDYENLTCLSQIPNLLSPSVQSVILEQVYARNPPEGIEALIDDLAHISYSSLLQFDNLRSHLLQYKPQLDLKESKVPLQSIDFHHLLFDLSPSKVHNVLKGPYGSFPHYLDTHFRLLKEDFTSVLRNDRDSFRYLGVWKNKGEVDEAVYTLSPQTYDLDRVKVGSLLRIEDKIFARVLGVKRERNELSISVFFSIKLPEECLRVDEFVIFFEPYYQVLKALHQIKSFGRYNKNLVDTCGRREKYDQILCKKLDFSSVYGSKPSSTLPHFYGCEDFCDYLFKTIPRSRSERHLIQLSEAQNKLKEDLDKILLTSSQIDSLISAVSQEMTLIHGPPGTGKSYIGKMMMRVFLDNKSRICSDKGNPPILLISFTNQALDNLLEEMLSATRKVLRIGHQSQSESLNKLHEIHGYLKEKGIFPQVIYKYSRESRKADIPSVILENAYICSHVDIIGMTTTSLAKNYEFVQLLAPEVIIVEEASEMFESHLLPSLGKNTKHLILIGDHKQLRPKVANHEVSISNGLEISLFERLINNHPEVCIQLNEQRRCSLELFKMISSVLYEGLDNHHSSNVYGHVHGSDSSIQVYNHDFVEEEGLSSKSNIFEAEMSIALGEYLVRCGNMEEEITILSAYRGQVDYIKKLLSKSNILQNVQIETVDNFQGRENQIIILSLVRSEKETIGFLSINHRVTVALTRAKKGLFIIGNLNHLSQKSSIWKKIKSYFVKESLISNYFKLHCPRHKDLTSYTITSSQDLASITCSHICKMKYKGCNHLCNRVCSLSHSQHEDGAQCRQVCSLKCKHGHACSSEQCHGSFTPCPPCREVVKELTLDCGHILSVFCYAQDDENFLNQCRTMIQEPNPKCGHSLYRPCWNNSPIECQEICAQPLPCGHVCELKCHVDSEHGTCHKPCNRIYSDCGHICGKKCFEDCSSSCLEPIDKEMKCGHVMENVPCGEENISCTQRCDKKLNCGHGVCRRFCYECTDLCDPRQCSEMTLFRLDCGHELYAKCSSSNDGKKCRSKCNRTLLCGHPCPGYCSEPCDDNACEEVTQGDEVLDCGHKGIKSCGKGSQPCGESCNALAKPCGHPCSNLTCFECFNGQIHFPCQEPCGRMLLCGHRCNDVCGAPCPPCNSRCLMTCKHVKKCSAKCDELCQPDCKSKCEWSCSHGKCGYKCAGKKCKRCDHEITMTKNGHTFKARCTGFKPHEVKTSPKCPSMDEIYILLVDCEHWISENDFHKKLQSKMVGVIRCQDCFTPITSWIHGYKKEMRFKNKEEVVEIQDIFFRLKTNLIKNKSSILTSIQDSSFSKEFKNKLSSDLSTMNLSNTIATEMKIKILQHLDETVQEASPQIYSNLKALIEKTGALPIGRDYIMQLNAYLVSKGFSKLYLKDCFYSFDVNSWSVSGSNVFSCDLNNINSTEE